MISPDENIKLVSGSLINFEIMDKEKAKGRKLLELYATLIQNFIPYPFERKSDLSPYYNIHYYDDYNRFIQNRIFSFIWAYPIKKKKIHIFLTIEQTDRSKEIIHDNYNCDEFKIKVNENYFNDHIKEFCDKATEIIKKKLICEGAIVIDKNCFYRVQKK